MGTAKRLLITGPNQLIVGPRPAFMSGSEDSKCRGGTIASKWDSRPMAQIAPYDD